MNTMMKYAMMFTSVGLLMLTAFLVLDSALSIPDVWFSYSSNECVKVINYASGDSYSCENLPSKFNHVWVK